MSEDYSDVSRGYRSNFSSELTDVAADTFHVQTSDEWGGMTRGEVVWVGIQHWERAGMVLARAYISAVLHGSPVPPVPPTLAAFIEAAGGLPAPAPTMPGVGPVPGPVYSPALA